MKRILIFSTAYIPFIGGAEVAVKEITDRIESYSFDMITAKMDRALPAHERVGNIDVYRIGIGIPIIDKFFLALFGHRKALQLHKKNHYDLVWSIMASYSGFAASTFKKKSGVKLLLTLQEGDPFEYILKKVRFVRKRFDDIFGRADGLQAISNYLMKWGKEMGFTGSIAQVVPNGVDVKRFRVEISKEQIATQRQGFGFDDNAYILVTASRLVKKNGVEHVIQSLEQLPTHVCFVVCGTGELQPQLETLVRKLNLSSRVLFLGNVSHKNLPTILKASDVFIRPSLSEGLGNAFLEGMAAGLPTIGTPVGGIPDFLEDRKTGFLCKPENPESIVNAVKNIMSLSAQEWEQIQQNAFQTIEEAYTWASVHNKMKQIFNTICAS